MGIYAQVAINNNGADPHASAMLDIQSTNKGLLIPRMNYSQMVQIPSPAEGLLAYVQDKNAFYYYDGQNWVLASADNLGNHKAAENLQMQGYWISQDGDDEGIFVNQNGDVGIGTDSPEGRLHVLMDQTTNNIMIERNENAKRVAGLVFRRSRGTHDHKLALQNKDGIASFVGWSWTGREWQHSARITFKVDGNVTSSAIPARITFHTQGQRPQDWALRMVIDSKGNIGINEKYPQRNLHIKYIMRLEPTDEPNNPAAGDIYYDKTLNKLRYYDGTNWNNL